MNRTCYLLLFIHCWEPHPDGSTLHLQDVIKTFYEFYGRDGNVWQSYCTLTCREAVFLRTDMVQGGTQWPQFRTSSQNDERVTNVRDTCSCPLGRTRNAQGSRKWRVSRSGEFLARCWRLLMRRLHVVKVCLSMPIRPPHVLE